VSLYNNDFKSFICRKTLIEGFEVSDGRNTQNMWTGWVCSIECGLSAYSHLLVLKYAIYALVVWTVSVEYHTGVLNLLVGATQ